MHDVQMHDNEASNAWRVIQKSKELDQGPKEYKLNHRNPSSSKQNDYLQWVSHEKWYGVGRMRIGDAHRQWGKNIKNFLQQLTIFSKIQFSLQSTTSKKLKFLFSFDFFKNLKLREMRSKMTKGTTIVTNNGFKSTRLFRETSSNMVLFFLQYETLWFYVTDHTTMVTSENKFRSIQILKTRPKQKLRLKSLSFHFLVSFVWRNVHRFVFRGRTHIRHKIGHYNMIATKIYFLFSDMFNNQTLDMHLKTFIFTFKIIN